MSERAFKAKLPGTRQLPRLPWDAGFLLYTVHVYLQVYFYALLVCKLVDHLVLVVNKPACPQS